MNVPKLYIVEYSFVGPSEVVYDFYEVIDREGDVLLYLTEFGIHKYTRNTKTIEGGVFATTNPELTERDMSVSSYDITQTQYEMNRDIHVKQLMLPLKHLHEEYNGDWFSILGDYTANKLEYNNVHSKTNRDLRRKFLEEKIGYSVGKEIEDDAEVDDPTDSDLTELFREDTDDEEEYPWLNGDTDDEDE